MVFDSLSTLSLQNTVKSPISFNFGSYSYREIFFDSSFFQFNFGFLTTPVSTAIGNSNFKCLVFENANNVLTLSDKWKQLDLSTLSSVKLYPKVEIEDPSSILYTMKCYGSGVPTGVNTSSMQLIWKDSTADVQTATSLSLPSNYVASASGTVSASLTTKRFVSEGMKAFYTFSISANVALDENSRIYFNFHMNVGSKLDREGSVECYTRLNGVIDDTEAVFSYCEFTYDHQIVLWNNRNLATNTVFYVDIFNIQQPKASDTTPNTITVSIDTDGDYNGGIFGTNDVTDTAASSNTINNIIIEDTSMSSTFIRTPQDITIKFDTITNILTGGANIYLLFPAEYGEWINRGSTLNTANSTCLLEADNNAGVNVLNACLFISKRVLKMTVNTGTSHNLHTIKLKSIYSPSKLPEGKYNQYRFKLFMVDGT